jgi:hypothetical protein
MEETTEVQATDVATGNGEPPSEFARLRARRAAIALRKTVDLEVPGYQGDLLVRYHLLDWQVVRKLLQHLDPTRATLQESEREFNAQVDTLIQACEGLYFRKEDGTLHDLECKWDKTFSEHMGYDPDLAASARAVVKLTFDNDLALSAHYVELMNWMNGQSVEADEEFSGESQAQRQ